MSLQSWQETLISAQVDGTALANTTTATSIIPASAKFTLPANFFSIGKVLRVTAQGRISNTATPTITFDIRLGAVIVFTSGAITTVTTITNKTWQLEVLLTCRAIGASTSANLMGAGSWNTSAVASNNSIIPDTAPVVGTGFDSTNSQTVDVFATWSAASASNTITLHSYILESLN